ncbi:MAG TPA: saccharopine dehydrogenase C-terminal domain-containing protein [Flavobacteriales bacterium]|nr:saccharopine dehydrogenase C-terminal domain-containing protein [Flavobacteriales bacterium]
MSRIVVFGAGRSAGFFIEYIFQLVKKENWSLVVTDQHIDHLTPLFSTYTNAQALVSDVNNPEQRKSLIQNADWVVSMLPALMHTIIAEDCVNYGVNMATASYESDDMRSMKSEIERKGLQFLNECGLDPGIDHMSAMRIIHKLQASGAHLTAFRSYCGGLVAHDCIDNPWGYKFSWNPRNVILAGQGTARYLEGGRLKFKPYSRLFQEPDTIRFSGGVCYDGYPNRDSISYREVYGLNAIQTMIRGTLRHPGYCKAWNVFVQLGITDDSYSFPLSSSTTYFDFVDAFLPGDGKDLKSRFQLLMGNSYDEDTIEKIAWTGILDEVIIPLKGAHSPASILQELLERKWKLNPTDRDLVVMQHVFEYELDGNSFECRSSLHIEGENNIRTAMGKTVGLPLAIALKNLILGNCKQKGLLIPVIPELYEPVLQELENDFGIRFEEEELMVQNR